MFAHIVLALAAILALLAAPCQALSEDSSDPFHFYPKRGVTTSTQAGDWTLTIEEDVVARKPLSAYASLTSASLTSPNFTLECHRFDPHVPGLHRQIFAITHAYYMTWPPPGLASAVVRVGDNEPIKFLGAPSGVGKGGVVTGAAEIWDKILTELPGASSIAVEVEYAQAVMTARGFSAVKEKLLAACDAMDR